MVDVVPEKSHIALAVDKTGSTTTSTWDHDGDAQTSKISRWNSIYNVLSTVLVGFEDAEEMALALFPSEAATSEFNAKACVTSPSAEVAMALSNADEIKLNLPGPLATNGGGTAIGKGLVNALAQLEGAPEYAPRAIVLITDGAANCPEGAITVTELFETYDETVHTLVTDAYAEGIVTYVIGLEISDVPNGTALDGKPNNIVPFDKLNELAVQGGRPLPGSTKFYQTLDEIELKLSVQNVLEDAKSCNLAFGDAAPEPTATLVEVAGKSYGYVENLDCASGDGWIYLDDTFTALRLCGAPCAELKATEAATVTIGC